MSEKSNAVNKVEFDAAAQQAAESQSSYTHVFKTPFKREGKTYESLTFDWDKLTGKDFLAIENEMTLLGRPVITPEFSGNFLVRMAARACTTKISVDILEAMPLRDYNRIRSKARSFLLMSGS